MIFISIANFLLTAAKTSKSLSAEYRDLTFTLSEDPLPRKLILIINVFFCLRVYIFK